MGVGIQVGDIHYEIGAASFLHAFFSTISGNLEDRWGSHFPRLMNELYQGRLPPGGAASALVELAEVESRLAHLAPDRVIWDIEDRSKQPPWGNNIAPEITDLSNYFVTSDGRDLINVLRKALEASRDQNAPAEIM